MRSYRSETAEFTLAYEKGGSAVLVWKASCTNVKKPVPYTPAPGQQGSSPKAEDGFNSIFWILIGVTAVAGTVILIVINRRKKINVEEIES